MLLKAILVSFKVSIILTLFIYIFTGNGIVLEFSEVDIVTSDSCERDYLEIRSTNSTGNILGIFCGNSLPNSISHNSSLWMLFESKSVDGEDATTGKGFMVQYTMSMYTLYKINRYTLLYSVFLNYVPIFQNE